MAKLAASAAFVGLARVASWYVRELHTSRTSAFTSNPLSIKRSASASSRAALAGGLETLTSSTGSTTPRPVWCAQTRLATFRLKYGFSGEVSHAASASRRVSPRYSPLKSGVSPPRNFGATTWPVTGCFTSPPPSKTIFSRGSAPAFRFTWAKRAAKP